MDRLVQLGIGFAILGAILWPIEQFFASVPDKKVLRRLFRIDVFY
jgi:hypothetical protein